MSNCENFEKALAEADRLAQAGKREGKTDTITVACSGEGTKNGCRVVAYCRVRDGIIEDSGVQSGKCGINGYSPA